MLDLDSVLDQVTTATVRLFPEALCAVRLVDAAAGGYRLAAVSGGTADGRVPLIPFGQGLTHTVVGSRRPLAIRDIRADPRAAIGDASALDDRTAYYGVPIQAGQELFGVLSVCFSEPAGPTTDEKEIIEILAAHAAVAIRNARLFSASEARRRAAEALAAVGRVLSQSLDPPEVAQRIVTNVRTILQARSASVFRLDETTGALVPVASSADAGPTWGGELPRGAGVGALAVRDRVPVVTADVLMDERIHLTPEVRTRLEKAQYRAILALPLIVQGTVIGTLVVRDERGRRFDQESIAVAEAFADQAALAFHNARLYEDSIRRRRVAEHLADVAKMLTQSANVDDQAARLVDKVRQIFRVRAARIDRRGSDGAPLLLAFAGPADGSTDLGDQIVRAGLFAGAVTERRPVWTADVLNYSRVPLTEETRGRIAETGYRSVMVVPLLVNAEVVGTLAIADEVGRTFDDSDVQLAEAVADQAAVALEKARSEEALRQNEKLASMGRLLAGVAHELNNPLSVIIGSVQLLDGHVTSDAGQRRLARIADAGQQCARIVRMFLSLARKQPTAHERVDVNAVIDRALDLLEAQLRVVDIEVVRDVDRNLPQIWGDSYQLLQVLLNLVANARAAMLGVSARRVLRVTTRFKPDVERVTVDIGDTGPGIPPDVQRQIFDPFFTTKPVGEGTGLGLAVCHSIVARHNGTIGVVSQPGAGTTFSIELPLGAGGDAAPGPAPDATDGRRPAPKRILVVDDEADVASTLSDTLSADGHEVETAENGQVAVAKLRDKSFDVILSDIRMPVLDGIAFYRAIEATQPGLCRRIIFMTGDVVSPETNTFLKTTAVRSLTKPFPIADLRRAIEA